MATMRENLDTLLNLQKIDSERDKLQRQIAGLDGGAAAQRGSSSARASAQEQHNSAAKSAGALKDAELELAGLEKKLKSYEDRMRTGTITNPREVANTEREINQLIRQRASLDEKILTLMEEGEKLRTAVTEADASAREAEQRYHTQVDSMRAQREEWEASLSALTRRRAEAAALVTDPALLKRYETIRSRPASSGVAIARVEDSHCGGCHTQIGTQEAHRAYEGAQVTLCENCGRILA